MTIADLKVLNFGYLTGSDLIRWCSPTLLINQLTIDADALQTAYDQATSEIISNFSTRYDLSTELTKTGVSRSRHLVKILSISSVRNALGNLEHISDTMQGNFDWVKWEVYNIRQGQSNLPLPSATRCVSSRAELVHDKFKTLG